MAAHEQELKRLLRLRQKYFLPLYIDIVNRYPEGVLAGVVKDEVAALLLSRFGIDIADPAQVGMNPSTERSRADQWTNNLVSNRVLDDYMLVVRSHRATLYPGGDDNSQPLVPTGPSLREAEIAELNDRHPTKSPPSTSTPSSTPFLRSLQLAAHVRADNGYQCAVGGKPCSSFNARDGHPYVEVHHIIPMAQQSDSAINLDRVRNMAPLCAGHHTCLHRGGAVDASQVLDDVLKWFELKHGQSFSDANSDLDLGSAPTDILSMYGLP